MTKGHQKSKNRNNKIKREVDRDVKQRMNAQRRQANVPFIQPKNGLPIKTRSRVNGRLSDDQNTIRQLVHRAGTDGCSPLMKQAIQQFVKPFAKA